MYNQMKDTGSEPSLYSEFWGTQGYVSVLDLSELTSWWRKQDIYLDLITAPPPKSLTSQYQHFFPPSFHATCSWTSLGLPVSALCFLLIHQCGFIFFAISAYILRCNTLATPAPRTALAWTFTFPIHLPWKPPSTGHVQSFAMSVWMAGLP